MLHFVVLTLQETTTNFSFRLRRDDDLLDRLHCGGGGRNGRELGGGAVTIRGMGGLSFEKVATVQMCELHLDFGCVRAVERLHDGCPDGRKPPSVLFLVCGKNLNVRIV